MKNIFITDRKSSFKSSFYGMAMNWIRTYRLTGGRVYFVSEDLQEIHVKLKLRWGTRNYVGTMFGGSLYSAADPVYMLQLIQLLGKEYVVWDKAAAIQFRRPGNQTLYIRFVITDELLASIRERVVTEREFDLELETEWVDKNGKVYATVFKTLYIANKDYYKEKRAKKNKSS
jgi:hypothetical protein